MLHFLRCLLNYSRCLICTVRMCDGLHTGHFTTTVSLWPCFIFLYSTVIHTWSDNTVRELIAVKVLYTSLLNTTVVAFKVLPLGSYAPMPAPSPHFKTILQMVLWKGLQSCRCINPDDISVIKMPSFQYFLYLREQKKVTVGYTCIRQTCTNISLISFPLFSSLTEKFNVRSLL